MEKKANKISVLKVVVFIFSFAAGYFIIAYLLDKNEITANEMLLEHSRQENQKLPRMLDEETRLDSLSVENITLKFHHTLLSTVKDSSDLDFELIKEGMIKIAQENLDTNLVMKDYRDNNVSLHYIFTDKNEKEVFDYTVKHHKP
jgi:hypothetical protein